MLHKSLIAQNIKYGRKSLKNVSIFIEISLSLDQYWNLHVFTCIVHNFLMDYRYGFHYGQFKLNIVLLNVMFLFGASGVFLLLLLLYWNLVSLKKMSFLQVLLGLYFTTFDAWKTLGGKNEYLMLIVVHFDSIFAQH